MSTRIYIFLLAITVLVLQVQLKAQSQCPIIPQPSKAVETGAVFTLNKNTVINISDDALLPVARYFQRELLEQNKIPVNLQNKKNVPVLQLVIAKKKGNEEAYNIQMGKEAIIITGESRSAVFNGIISLLQLITQSKSTGDNILLNCWNIEDTPLYNWRGLMLDESRHFFGMEKVKSILNWMAFYKLNRFHWHLTDEPAWRIEIKNYPNLALVGGIGSYTNPNVPAQFYTQQQIVEVISYAAERNITVIPEIDMPGHATAANRAYSQYSGGGNPQHPEFTFHPGKDETYQYLTNILREVNALFPSGMIHLGGDEVSFGNDKWMADKQVQDLMKKKQLKTVTEVEQYFMQRMADSLYGMNAKLLAWDEVANMSFPTDKTIVYWWRHDKPGQLLTALNKGYSTVICPRLPFYFDFVQDSTHTVGRKWNKLYNSLQNVYDYNVGLIAGVTEKNKKQILGIQANIWTETMTNSYQLDYMLYPRIAALAETAWSENKNFTDFKNRLQKNFGLYKAAGINFYKPF